MLDGVIRISFILENVTFFLASKQYNTQLSQCFSYLPCLHVVADTTRITLSEMSTFSIYLNRLKNPCYCSCHQYETLLPSSWSSSNSLKLTTFELVTHYIIINRAYKFTLTKIVPILYLFYIYYLNYFSLIFCFFSLFFQTILKLFLNNFKPIILKQKIVKK